MTDDDDVERIARVIDVSASEWLHNLALQKELTDHAHTMIADEVRTWIESEVTRGGFVDYPEFLEVLQHRLADAVRIIAKARDSLKGEEHGR